MGRRHQPETPAEPEIIRVIKAALRGEPVAIKCKEANDRPGETTSKPADDPRRWRRPKEKPETDDYVEAWIEESYGIFCTPTVHYKHNAKRWYNGYSCAYVVKVLAWRPIQKPDMPAWVKKRKAAKRD